ncbi:hypothetical protein [Kitasatospora mediocidica]|uniref:hypothetical protein n=1 Tax=Kitasatospora mediocidica TaxID=58352 RepID=UPI000563B993|nr:hypothetical protein [Kitasatospora mediocidica]
MSPTPREVLQSIRREFAPADGSNRLIAPIEQGTAPLAVLGELAAQQHHVITSDRRSFLLLATRCSDSPVGGYFSRLADGESRALTALAAFTAGCGREAATGPGHEPLAGCQTYPNYLAWLALNGDPIAVVLALSANFADWGTSCAITARALRRRYGFSDASCAFFDFFAVPAPELEDEALSVITAGGLTPERIALGRRYARLLQHYELLFWNTLADQVPGLA